MGYYINERNIHNCVITKDKIEEAVKIINDLSRNNKISKWVNNIILDNSTNIEEIMEELRWPGSINDNGDFEIEYFSGEKYGDEDIIFDALAKVMPDGSYIEMQGEGGELWRWYFEKGKLIEKNAKIIWE